MKPSVLLSVLVLALVVSTQTFAQAPRPSTTQDVRAEFEQLKRDIVRLNKELADIKAAKGPTMAEHDEVVAYLQAQAASATEMMAVLDDSEEKGFTWGINSESRIVLLVGLRKAYAVRQAGVPGAETEE